MSPEGEKLSSKPQFFHRFTVVYKPLWILSGHEKDVVNYDLFLKNTAIWKEKNKREKKPTYAHVKNLNFSYENRDWAATRQVVTHSSTKICLFQAFCIISSKLFPFKLLLMCLDLLYLPPPPTVKRINIAWPWCGLHYISVCIVKPYLLHQWVIRGEGGSNEEF